MHTINVKNWCFKDYQLVNVMGIAHVQKIPQKIESVVIVVIKQGVTTAKFGILTNFATI